VLLLQQDSGVLSCVEEAVVLERLVWVWGSEIGKSDADDTKGGTYGALWYCVAGKPGSGDTGGVDAAVYAVTAERGRF
jgi:hypothetical protein